MHVAGLMVYGADDPKLQDSFARLLASDPVYGATPSYLAVLQRYLEGEETARVDDGAAAFLARLASQRRRLFFALPDDDPDYHFWSMTDPIRGRLPRHDGDAQGGPRHQRPPWLEARARKTSLKTPGVRTKTWTTGR